MPTRKFCAYRDKGLIMAQVLSMGTFILGLYHILACIGCGLGMLLLATSIVWVVRKWVFWAAAFFEVVGVVGQILHAVWAKEINEEDCESDDGSNRDEDGLCSDKNLRIFAIVSAVVTAGLVVLICDFAYNRYDALQERILAEIDQSEEQTVPQSEKNAENAPDEEVPKEDYTTVEFHHAEQAPNQEEL